MVASELREKILIMGPIAQQRDEGDIFADVTPEVTAPCDYKKLYTLRAGVKYKTGDEAYIDEQKTVIQSVRFKVRYNPRIRESHSIEYKGVRFDIRFIEHSGIGSNTTTYLHTERKVD